MRSQDWVIEIVSDARTLIATCLVGCTLVALHLSSRTSTPQPTPVAVPRADPRPADAAQGDLARPCTTAPAKVPVDRPSGLVVTADGRTYAVVALFYRLDECSGAGGEHYTLQLDEPGNAPRWIHAGGHGSYLALDGADHFQTLGAPLQLGTSYFVAEIALHDTPAGEYDAPGWCIQGMPAYAGYVLRLRRASGRDDARRQLAQIAARPGDPGNGEREAGWQYASP